MLNRIIDRLFKRPAPLTPRLPAGVVAYAVGDIHGRRDLLDDLLERVAADPTHRTTRERYLIFLGDYGDRGRQSREVYDRLTEPMPADFTPVFLRGNHEQTLEHFLKGNLPPAGLAKWMFHGGTELMLSYGVRIDSAQKDEALLRDLQQQMQERFPPAHRRFLDELKPSFALGDYFFAHAGVDPKRPLDRQKDHDLMWVGESFLTHDQPLEKMIVHGHRIGEEVAFRLHRIGVDTGAYATGRLSALGLAGTRQWVLQTGQPVPPAPESAATPRPH